MTHLRPAKIVGPRGKPVNILSEQVVDTASIKTALHRIEYLNPKKIPDDIVVEQDWIVSTVATYEQRRILTVGAPALRTADTFCEAVFGYPAYARVTPYCEKVSEVLYRGSQPYEGEMRALADLGIRAIISMRAESKRNPEIARNAGLKFRHFRIGCVDHRVPPLAAIQKFIELIKDPCNQPAYLHCYGGVGRTGVAVACYRTAVENRSLAEALFEFNKFGARQDAQREFIERFGEGLNNSFQNFENRFCAK